ncbi:MAG: UDP-N-acetylglucosamine--N-acetylmuramyl-(pentapeptide) pyrophosphoryl-undecaprenol N-acetylglucosamine transferase [Candidatus Coatesbacteria bacterium]|nr:UDP-N-acetylglucosamine--N-acetylmuramyl-(pentapeptide) pyrophosphoryl-undecaprenol N-acetylglucosamine transferase [Candidatus Coatesbacteria bacterium]
MPTKIVLVSGGTGGHIYPSIALAEEFSSFYGDAVKLYFMGTMNRLDSKIIPSMGYYYKGLPVDALSSDWKHPQKLVKNWIKWFSGIDVLRARKFLKNKKVELVISFGSYISAPIILAAKTLGIPFCLIELDSLFGQTNRIFSRWSSRLFTCFENPEGKIFKHASPIHVGFIFRESLIEGIKEYFIKRWHLSPSKKTVVILGGSLGSLVLNKTLLKMLLIFDEDESMVEKLQFIQITGERYFNEIKKQELPKNIRLHLVPYVKEMNHLYALSDLIISRAGGSTIAELVSLCKPSILIPWEGAKHNHQSKNAELLKSVNGCMVIKEKDLDYQQLSYSLRNIISNDEIIQNMKLGLLKLQLKEKAVTIISRESVQTVRG